MKQLLFDRLNPERTASYKEMARRLNADGVPTLSENYQYRAPRLIQLRGVWVVKVSIPTHMKHLFGNGAGTTRDRRKPTKTNDYKIAKSRECKLTQIVYDEFDEKLRLQSEQQN